MNLQINKGHSAYRAIDIETLWILKNIKHILVNLKLAFLYYYPCLYYIQKCPGIYCKRNLRTAQKNSPSTTGAHNLQIHIRHP